MFAARTGGHTVQVVGRRKHAPVPPHTRNSTVVYSFLGDCRILRWSSITHEALPPSEVISTSGVLLLCPEPGIFIFPALSPSMLYLCLWREDPAPTYLHVTDATVAGAIFDASYSRYPFM
jgi:hypothetical protein